MFAGVGMDEEFYRQQALRVRDLAGKADPFTRRRLLDLADRYDAKGGAPSLASRAIERPLPLPRANQSIDRPVRHEEAPARRDRVQSLQRDRLSAGASAGARSQNLSGAMPKVRRQRSGDRARMTARFLVIQL
jgi:hypothetical protein